jgi:hypothetical protein
MSIVKSFTEFINESKINEMPHRRFGGPRSYRGYYGKSNGTSDHYSVNPKDKMRAEELSKRKVNTRESMTPLQIAIGNAGKMAKVITDPGKLIARMEAVYNEWGPGPVLQPFIDRIIELEPQHRKYVAAWRVGLADGRVAADPTNTGEEDEGSIAHIMAALGMLPPKEGFTGNSAEKIIYQVAYDKAMAEVETNVTVTP